MNQIIGQKLSINGTKLYYEYIEGTQHNLTVVLESGYGWDLNNWGSIKDEISKFANVFMYDRNSIGKSDKSSKPKNSLANVENLRLLLQKAEVKPPYILVGHSFGGVNVRLFASMYSKDISGVLLLDSVHEDQNIKMVPLFTKEVQNQYLSQFKVEASLNEFEESLEQVRGTKLYDLPLIVMTGGTQPHHTNDSMNAWMEFQKDLAKLSSKSKHILLEEAGHAIHLDNPKQVIKAISELCGLKHIK